MKPNVGTIDKIIRYILGGGLIAAGIISQIRIGRLWWLALIGGVLVITALLSRCPLYLPFKISTVGKKK